MPAPEKQRPPNQASYTYGTPPIADMVCIYKKEPKNPPFAQSIHVSSDLLILGNMFLHFLDFMKKKGPHVSDHLTRPRVKY